MTTGRAEFYRTRNGRMMAEILTGHLRAIIGNDRSGDRAAIFGYGAPYRGMLEDFFPPVLDLRQSGEPYDDCIRGRAALVDGNALPIASSSLDFLIVVHGNGDLAEYARVLDGNGRLVLVAPCRRRPRRPRRRKNPPFGGETVYSAAGLRRRLQTHGFEITAMRRALVLPPSRWPERHYSRFAERAEKLAGITGAVVIVDARKMIYSIRGVPKARTNFFKAWATMTPKTG